MQRVRSSTLYELVSSYTSYNRSLCTTGFSSSVTTFTNRGVKEISDCVDPNYHHKERIGGVFSYLPAHIRREDQTIISPSSFTAHNGTCQTGYGDRTWDLSNWTAVSLPSFDAGKISYVANQAIARAKAEAFDALTFAAELGKTNRMVANRVNRTFDLAEKAEARASRKRGRAPTLRDFNNAWLELRYGWRPLLHDVDNGVRQLFEVPFNRQRGRCLLSESLEGYAQKVSDFTVVRLTADTTLTGTRTYRGFAIANGDFGQSPSFRPLDTAWELIPFSFVVDWFWDLGTYLSAAAPVPGVDIRACGYSVRDSWKVVYTGNVTKKPSAPAGTTISQSQAYRSEVSCEEYTRQPTGAVVPSFYPRLNQLKLIDIASLVFQRAAPLSRFLRR